MPLVYSSLSIDSVLGVAPLADRLALDDLLIACQAMQCIASRSVNRCTCHAPADQACRQSISHELRSNLLCGGFCPAHWSCICYHLYSTVAHTQKAIPTVEIL